MNRIEALKLANSLGCTIDYPIRTGEARITFPDGRRVRINNRRKDVARRVAGMLRREADASSGTS